MEIVFLYWFHQELFTCATSCGVAHYWSSLGWSKLTSKPAHKLQDTQAEKDPTLPPSTGWQFRKKGKFEEEPSVRCRALPAGSPPCSVTLKLSGLAKDFQGKCEGEYKDTGMRSMGRQVTVSSIKSFPHFKQFTGVQT